MSQRPLILHITGDYPEPTRTPTTLAVKTFISNLTDCDHVIVSLTRTADPRRTLLRELPAPAGQRLFAMHHFGLPLGVGLMASFRVVARRIEQVLAAHDLQPTHVHAHRLTFDGIAAWLLAQRRAIPLLVSVRGEVESKVFRFKPTYAPFYTRLLRDAHRIYYVSAWFRSQLERLDADLGNKARLLPNIVANTQIQITPRAPAQRIMAVANLDIYRKKGIDRLIAGFAAAAAQLPGVTLDIVGAGRRENVEALQRLIEVSGHRASIRLRGPLANAALLAELPTALAFALPSRNETFGMVYTEALFAGVPILYSRGTGVDGHLDGLDIGVAVAPDDTEAIAAALIELARHNDRFRANIAAGAKELYRRFDASAQVAMYMDDLAAARKPAPCAKNENGAVHA